MLNEVENGAIKSVDQWMRYWNDQKKTVKARAAHIHRALGRGTGGGPALDVYLSSYELRVLACMGGWVRITGFADIVDPLEVDPMEFNPPPPLQAHQRFAQPQPLNQQFAPPAQRLAQPPQQFIPPAQRLAQPQQFIPPAQRLAQPPQQFTPPAQRLTQPPQQFTPPAQRLAQPPQQFTPPAQRLAQPPQQFTPPAQRLAQPQWSAPSEQEEQQQLVATHQPEAHPPQPFKRMRTESIDVEVEEPHCEPTVDMNWVLDEAGLPSTFTDLFPSLDLMGSAMAKSDALLPDPVQPSTSAGQTVQTTVPAAAALKSSMSVQPVQPSTVNFQQYQRSLPVIQPCLVPASSSTGKFIPLQPNNSAGPNVNTSVLVSTSVMSTVKQSTSAAQTIKTTVPAAAAFKSNNSVQPAVNSQPHTQSLAAMQPSRVPAASGIRKLISVLPRTSGPTVKTTSLAATSVMSTVKQSTSAAQTIKTTVPAAASFKSKNSVQPVQPSTVISGLPWSTSLKGKKLKSPPVATSTPVKDGLRYLVLRAPLGELRFNENN